MTVTIQPVAKFKNLYNNAVHNTGSFVRAADIQFEFAEALNSGYKEKKQNDGDNESDGDNGRLVRWIKKEYSASLGFYEKAQEKYANQETPQEKVCYASLQRKIDY